MEPEENRDFKMGARERARKARQRQQRIITAVICLLAAVILVLVICLVTRLANRSTEGDAPNSDDITMIDQNINSENQTLDEDDTVSPSVLDNEPEETTDPSAAVEETAEPSETPTASPSPSPAVSPSPSPTASASPSPSPSPSPTTSANAGGTTTTTTTTRTYRVAFATNGGSSIASQTVTSGRMASRPANPTRSGYTFGGWYTDTALTKEFSFSTKVTSNLVLYAKWTSTSYTVSFNSNGGSAVSALTVSNGGTVTQPPYPTRTGYTFGGWFTDTALTQAYDFSTKVYSSLTLYAKWSAVTYTVTFDSQGGTAVAAQTVASGAAAAAPANPALQNYTFTGWFTDAACTSAYNFSTAVTGDLTLYAGWTINGYTVTFDSNGGSAVSAQMVNVGSVATQPAAPVHTGSIFTGWFMDAAATMPYDFATVVSSNMTLYAGWTPVVLTVNLDPNDGVTAATAQSIYYGGTVSRPADPVREGYVFTGWCTDIAGTTGYDFASAVTWDFTLYAQWVPANCVVTFNSTGGSAVSSQSMTSGAAAEPPKDPTWAGHVFLGWFTDEACTEKYDFATVVTENITLYAGWRDMSAVTLPDDTEADLTDTSVSYTSSTYGFGVKLADCFEEQSSTATAAAYEQEALEMTLNIAGRAAGNNTLRTRYNDLLADIRAEIALEKAEAEGASQGVKVISRTITTTYYQVVWTADGNTNTERVYLKDKVFTILTASYPTENELYCSYLLNSVIDSYTPAK